MKIQNIMIFSKKAILAAMQQGRLVIAPFEQSSIEAAHINLHLDTNGGEMTLLPQEFGLAKTLEKISLDDTLCGSIEGRASLAKQGISIEQSSTFIEPGTNNHITLEVFNASNNTVILKSGQPIAKLLVMKVIDSI